MATALDSVETPAFLYFKSTDPPSVFPVNHVIPQNPIWEQNGYPWTAIKKPSVDRVKRSL